MVSSITTLYKIKSTTLIYTQRHFLISGEADAAFVFYEDALTLYRSALGKNHAIASKPLTKLGAYFIQKRKHDEAKNLLQEAIQLYCDHDLLDDLICAEIHFNLGIVYCETGELERAMDSYEVCLQIRRRELGCEDINVAQVSVTVLNIFENLNLYKCRSYTHKKFNS